MNKSYDAAIIGGGPTGAVAALVLARRGRRVILIDRPKRPARKVGEFLPATARPLLEHLGLLDIVLLGRHLISFGNFSAWGSPELTCVDAPSEPHGYGWNLDRLAFEGDLLLAAHNAGCVFHREAVRGLTRESDGWVIDTSEGKVQAGWVLDCSGRQAIVATKHGAEILKDDNMIAVFGWFKIQPRDKETRTLIEATQDGWWYSARLPDLTRLISFHTDSTHASRLFRSGSDFLRLLLSTSHMRQFATKAPAVGGLQTGEAGGSRLTRFHGDGWLAAGDAALAFDPLTSQGLFNALYTGLRAAETLHAVLGGEAQALTDYEARLETLRTAYVNHHEAYYAAETRWLQAPFWKDRRLAIEVRKSGSF